MNNARRKLISETLGKLQELLPNLEQARDEERDAFDNMPEGLQQSERGQASGQSADSLDNAVSSLEETTSN